uniref:H(+)-exporting diphosphatase n=1 Tax=Mucochytrium quahogii TaxID=96639 RepID=A0A7S2RHX6_9STRA|mmetsp:Transcript_10516/g.17150  ORF Transcript_10516/g.17150 Transcript_10516/m.17150 type:complete len:782 (+) Transcript_10516:145-2490(+)
MLPTYEISGGSFLAMIIILGAGGVGIFFAFVQYGKIRSIRIRALNNEHRGNGEDTSLVADENGSLGKDKTENLIEIYQAISVGAKSFLYAEYRICVLFLIVFGGIVFVLVGSAGNCGPAASAMNAAGKTEEGSCWQEGFYTTIAFVIGGVTSIVSGYIGMMIAVYTNARCTTCAQIGWQPAFNAAFRGGAVMGFALCALAMLVLFVLITVFSWTFVDTGAATGEGASTYVYKILFEVVAGYGLGGSSIALFGRVGGGIYTKAADVGADLVGKIEQDIPEDDPRNPATIADNVGDNVGDVAGMGADLFGSFAESTCAALVLSSASPQLQANWGSMMYPVLISAVGLLVCFATSFVATDISPVRKEQDVEKVLKMQLILTTLFITPAVFVVSLMFLPSVFCVAMPGEECLSDDQRATWFHAFACVASGLWAGLATGLITEYYTSHSYAPVREVAEACKTGAATNIIYGLALGYKSVIVPTIALGSTIFVSFRLCGMYGIALAALGMLSSLSTGLTIDAYGPITDNAGGIAEMAELGSSVRHITDTLDAAGNTTAAIGKGFAIGSAALVSLALYGAFVSRIGAHSVNILEPIVFQFLLFGAMLPYWFSAMTMKSVGIAAIAMVIEVRSQFQRIPGLMEGTAKPDYERCVEISTQASLREMIAPGALVILSPLITGYFFGVHALTGLLAGALVSGVQMAISASNTGGAWDNAKKYIEGGNLGGKGSDPHKAAVVGDTVGDPLKDTSGPALNILMKLMAIISLVFADFFKSHALPAGQRWAGYPQK